MALGYYDQIKNKIIVVLQLRINPPSNHSHKIRYHSIIEFINYLINERKFNIKYLWVDGYQSEYFIQYYQERKIEANLLGIDRVDSQYMQFRNSILENSVEYYDYDIFKEELFALIHDRAGKKVNHPPNGTKDVSDAVCRLFYGMKMKFYVAPQTNIKSTVLHLISRNRDINNMGDDISRNDLLKIENKLINERSKNIVGLINKKNSYLKK